MLLPRFSTTASILVVLALGTGNTAAAVITANNDNNGHMKRESIANAVHNNSRNAHHRLLAPREKENVTKLMKNGRNNNNRTTRNNNDQQQQSPSNLEKRNIPRDFQQHNGKSRNIPREEQEYQHNGKTKNNNKETIAEMLSKTTVTARPLVPSNSGRNGRNNGRNNRNNNNGRSSQQQQQQQQQQSQHEFPAKYPKVRYTPWNNLSKYTRDILSNSKGLGYNRSTWDNPGTHPLESKIFMELSMEQQEDLMILGMGEFVWDCFVTHYESYGRKDQVRMQVYDHVQTLQKAMTRSTPWKDLNQDEMYAANQLCYFEEIWDGKHLMLGKWGLV